MKWRTLAAVMAITLGSNSSAGAQTPATAPAGGQQRHLQGVIVAQKADHTFVVKGWLDEAGPEAGPASEYTVILPQGAPFVIHGSAAKADHSISTKYQSAGQLENETSAAWGAKTGPKSGLNGVVIEATVYMSGEKSASVVKGALRQACTSNTCHKPSCKNKCDWADECACPKK